jgi:hypothetical protein
MIDYKQKALKYKQKYEKLLEELNRINLEQYGGFNRDDYLVFENELKQIFNLVSGEFDEDNDEYVALTGSGALAYMLFKLGMNEELEEMSVPNDLDIVYYTKNKLNNFTKETIGDYAVESGKRMLDSRSFIIKPELQEGKKIRQFDLTKMKERKPEFIELEDRVNARSIKINIVNLDKLKELYLDSETAENEDKIKSRVDLIEKIKKHILNKGDPELLQKYKLDINVTKRGKPRSTFSLYEEDMEEGLEGESGKKTIFRKRSEISEPSPYRDLPTSRRLGLEDSPPRLNMEYGQESPSPYKKRNTLMDSDETLNGLSELDERLGTARKSSFRPQNLSMRFGSFNDELDDELGNESGNESDVETLAGISELARSRTNQSSKPVSRSLFEESDTLTGISELEQRKYKKKTNEIVQPQIRPDI